MHVHLKAVDFRLVSLLAVFPVLFLDEFFSSRAWKGLEQKLGETEVSSAVEGIRGIAAGYSHEQS